LSPSTRRWIQRLVPWVIAGATLAVILWKYPLSRIADEVARGDAIAMIPCALGVIGLVWFTSTTSDFLVLRTVVPDLRFFPLMRGKGGISVLNALGPALNYGGHALWIHRRFGAAPAAAAGVLMYIALGDLVGVAIWATSSIWLGSDVPESTRAGLGIAAPITLVVALTLLVIRTRSARPLLTPWRALPVLTRLAILGVRCATLGVIVTGTWAAMRGFGISVPFGAVATYLPILLVVAAMPINVAGLGPVQAAWLAVFAPWADGPTILAFQFLWHAMMLGALLLRGAPFLRQVVADITR
jgi:hypothetical protein